MLLLCACVLETGLLSARSFCLARARIIDGASSFAGKATHTHAYARERVRKTDGEFRSKECGARLTNKRDDRK